MIPLSFIESFLKSYISNQYAKCYFAWIAVRSWDGEYMAVNTLGKT
jgi:hypothetical protein